MDFKMKIKELYDFRSQVNAIAAKCHLYKKPKVRAYTVDPSSVFLSVNILESCRLKSALTLAEFQLGNGIRFDEAFVLDDSVSLSFVTPIVVEENPAGLFCLDGSHRLRALNELRCSKIEVLKISSDAPHMPPAQLFHPMLARVVRTVDDWRDRFECFNEELFRPFASELEKLGTEILKGISHTTK